MKTSLTKSLIDEVREGVTLVDYHTWAGTTATSCVMVYRDSITEVATSDTEDPARFDIEKGRAAAYQKAFNALVDSVAKVRKLARSVEQSAAYTESMEKVRGTLSEKTAD